MTTTTDQAAAERQAQAEAQAREYILDFAAMASAIVSLAEAITAKQGTLALDQLVRQRYQTQDAAARVWRRSGRQDAPAFAMPGIKEYPGAVRVPQTGRAG